MTNAGPFVRPRGVTSNQDHGDDRQRADRNADRGREEVSPIAWPIRFVRVVITTASRSNRPNLRHDLRGE